MSSISIAGDTSGSVTLAVPAAAGSTTVTIAAQTGTLNAAGPAFSASMSATQTPALSANTKLVFDTEDFDTNNNYDPTTNYRFTPTVAGYYQVNLCTSMSCAGAGANFGVVIFKNGSAYKASVGNNTANYWTPLSVSAVISMNGTSDYLEAYVASGVSQVTVYATRTVATTITVSSFSACLIRGA